MSNVAAIEGNTARAQEYAAQAVELGRANGLENLSSRGLISLGNAFFLRGELKEAEDYFQQALEFAQRARARRNMAAAQLSLGSLRIQQGEFEEGLRFVEQAAPFYREGRYYKELTSVQGLIGHANRNRGRYDVALAAFTEQLRAAEETGNQAQVARSHLDLGIVYADLERVGEALGEFEQSYAMYTSQKNLLMAGFSQINRAEVLWRVGRNRDAQAAADDVEQLASRPDINSKELRALALVNEAQLSLSERRFGEAIRKSEQALALGLTENKNISVDAKSILGLAEASTGAKERGRSICAEAVELATRADNPQLISTALLAQAEALLETGDFEGARRAALGLQQTSVRTGQHEKQWRAYFLAGLASQRLGDEPAAREHLSRARRLLDELQSKWGDVALSYLARTDIQSYRRALEQFFSAG